MEEWSRWRNSYRMELLQLCAIIKSAIISSQQERCDEVSAKIGKHIPSTISSEPLSRKALAIVMNLDGVTSVLNGMRKPSYVEDSMEVLKYQAFQVGNSVF